MREKSMTFKDNIKKSSLNEENKKYMYTETRNLPVFIRLSYLHCFTFNSSKKNIFLRYLKKKICELHF